MHVDAVVPVLRTHDAELAKAFYVGWLGFTLDWEEDWSPDGPRYFQVSRAGCVLHLSSHHDDGAPCAVVLLEVRGLDGLHAEITARPYPFFNPAVEPKGPGHEMQVIDPTSNRLRFYEPPRDSSLTRRPDG